MAIYTSLAPFADGDVLAPGAPRAGNRYDMPFTRPPVERGPRTTPRVALRFSGGARGTRHGPAAAVDFRDRPIIARYVCFRLLSSFNPSKTPQDEATVDVGFLGASTLLEASSDPALSELLDVGDGGAPPSLAGAWDLTSDSGPSGGSTTFCRSAPSGRPRSRPRSTASPWTWISSARPSSTTAASPAPRGTPPARKKLIF